MIVTTQDERPPADTARDEWLVVRCQLGERAAFDELIARWHPPLWRYVVRLAVDPDTAADVAQDVWLRVFRGLARLRDATKFRAWLFGIARRTVMDRLRIRYAQPVMDAVELDAIAGASPEADLEMDLARMETELDRLPVIERDVLVLFYLRELSLADIAEIAGVPIGTVKSRLFRARNLLRAQLIGKGVGP